MEEIKLDVFLRSRVGARKVKAVRRENCIPANVYGGDSGPVNIQVDRKIYERIMRSHQGGGAIFHLNVFDGQKKVKDYPAIIKEQQHDPVSDALLHIDFKRISLTEEIEVKVPIHTKGEAIGVKQGGGALDHHLWELTVVCLPTKIPNRIEIDISHLNIGEAVHVSDLKLPEGVRAKHQANDFVVSVVAAMKEELAQPAEGAPVAEVEVIKEKKDKVKPEEAAAAKKPEDKKEKKEG